ncbi:hypothetical protein [Streptacidiphilus melanogenes]|uniref:hypothetical protein n=1 Tax=Streptacidiphilus melanogenes TaxID=411235 RepID=UPI0005A8BDEB|nr:hypothetical protein [Streptacidiphilus melanogenes]
MHSSTLDHATNIRGTRSRRRILTAAGITALALSVAACGAAAHTTGSAAAPHSPPAATAPVTHLAANVAALTQQQLQSAAVTTSDVAGQQMGVLPMTDSPIEQSNTRVQPSTCEALASAWEGGGPDYPSTGAVDLKVMEGNSGQSGTAHLMHLASFNGTTATKLLNAIATAAGSCSSYTLPDPSGPIHEAITPIAAPQYGDQAVAWHAVLTGTSGQRYVSTVTVVRVGGTVINAVELANNLSSADQLPTTSAYLLNAQIAKLRAVS